MNIFQRFRHAWHAHQRALDLQFLWPACRESAPDLDTAKAAFAVHAFNDKAWLILGRQEIHHIITEELQ